MPGLLLGKSRKYSSSSIHSEKVMVSAAPSSDGVGKAAGDAQWLRSFVREHGDGRTAEQLFPKLGSATSISGEALSVLREHLEDQVAHAEQDIRRVADATTRLIHERKLWQEAGVDDLISALDTDAVQEGHELALACASLSLTPEQACQPSARASAVVALVAEATAVETRLAEREFELSDAQHALRRSALQLAHAVDTTNLVRTDIENRKHQVHSAQERANLMNVKAQQYDEAVQELEQRVRIAGLTERTTHDAVLNDSKLLTDLEQQLTQVNDALTKFHELPPVSLRRHCCLTCHP